MKETQEDKALLLYDGDEIYEFLNAHFANSFSFLNSARQKWRWRWTIIFPTSEKRVIVFQFSFVGNSFHFLRGNHYENSEKNVFHAYSQYKCTPLAIRQGKREQHRGHMVSHPINCKCDQKKTPKNIYFKTTSFWEG